MLQVCRICLLFITTADEFFEIENDSETLSPETLRYKITSFFPEMNLNISKPPVMCKSCRDTLEITFEFKLKCLKTEGMIIKFMQAKGMRENDVDLKHVALANNDQVVGAKISLENMDLIEVCTEIQVENHAAMPNQSSNDIKQECIEISDDEFNECQTDLSDFKIEHPSYYPKIIDLPPENEQSSFVDYDYAEPPAQSTTVELQDPPLDDDHTNRCGMCLKVFQSQARLRKHMSYHCRNRFNYVEDNGPKPCEDSNDDDFEVNVTPSGYLVHKKPKANVKKRFPCKLCAKKFRTPTGLSFHVNRYCKKKPKSSMRNQIKSHKCNECKKKIDSMLANENPYRCNICVRQIFHNYNAYKWHMKYVHDANPYDCKLCTKTFTSKKDLWNHSCPGNKGKECVGCKVKNTLFLTQYYGKRYLCKVCNEQFGNHESFGWHMEFVHKLEGLCGICFLIKDETRRHVCGFECSVCKNTFRNQEDLENHPHMYMQE